MQFSLVLASVVNLSVLTTGNHDFTATHTLTVDQQHYAMTLCVVIHWENTLGHIIAHGNTWNTYDNTHDNTHDNIHDNIYVNIHVDIHDNIHVNIYHNRW